MPAKTIEYKAWTITASGGEYEMDCAIRDAEQEEMEWLCETTDRMMGRPDWYGDTPCPAERYIACAEIHKYHADLRAWGRKS